MKQWHFEEKVYKRWLVLMICPWSELIESLKESEYKYIDDMLRAAGMNVRLNLENSNQTCTILWMPRWDSSILVHEITHLVMHTFNQVGVPIGIDNEEEFGFYMEYWFNEISKVKRMYPKGRTSKQAIH